MEPRTREQVLEEINKSDCRNVKVAITDLDGVLRGKYLHRDKFLSAVEGGFGFCDVIFGWDCADAAYDNAKFTGWHTGYPDAQARVDLSTFRRIPWDAQTPFFLGDFVDSAGKPLAVCPRQLLKSVIARAQARGFHASFGMEFEWFNFRETPQSLAKKNFISPEPLTPGMFGYSLLRASSSQPFFHALLNELGDFGVPLEGLHTETGPGVFEAAILYSSALEAADRAVLFKTSVKEIAYRFGILPTFMAKWHASLPGCSGHLHQSLWTIDGAKRKNVFHDDKDPHRMSDLHRCYLAGLIHCLPHILPFFAPTVNSYKRLTEGYWAPTRPTWGIDNRTVAFRVLPGSEKSTRIEARVPGADVNPYLAMAACLAAGLYGIEKRLPLGDATTGSGYTAEHLPKLPHTLQAATDAMSRSPIAKELFGEAFVDHFTRSREWEWSQFEGAVTNWEMERYFEII